MTALKYKVIKSKKQYGEYSDALESLVLTQQKTKTIIDEIELLEVLIEKWDDEHDTLGQQFSGDPVALIRALMSERKMKSKDLVAILGVSKGLVSAILNSRKGLSKQNVRLLANYFNIDTGLLVNNNV